MSGLRLGLLAVVLVALLAAAGCGGGDDDSAEGWANSVCESLSDWVTDLDETAQSLTDDGLALDSDDLSAAAGDARQATEELADDLRALDRPETEAVEQAEQELAELDAALQAELDRVEGALEEESPPLELAATVAEALSAAVDALRETYEALQTLGSGTAELADAFESSEECEALREQVEELRSE